MFSKLTTTKIIDGIFNLSEETYDEMVKLCKDALNNISNISHYSSAQELLNLIQ